MTRALQLAGIVALLAWALVGVQLVYTLERVNEAIAAATSAIQETQRRVAHTSANLNAVLIQAGLAADQLRRASERQGEYSTRLIATLDETTNMVREGRRTLEVAREQIEANGKASEEQIRDIGITARSSLRAAEGLAVEFRPSLVALGAAAANLAPLTAEAAATAREAHRGVTAAANAAESVDAALRPLRTSGGKMKAVLKFLLGLVKVNIR